MAQTTTPPAEDATEPIQSFSANDAKASIKITGAFLREDASVGCAVDQFVNLKKLPLRKPDGLEFCAQNSFYNKVN